MTRAASNLRPVKKMLMSSDGSAVLVMIMALDTLAPFLSLGR